MRRNAKRAMLRPAFFDRSALVVARDLLGKYLVRRVRGNPSTGLRAREIALMITETEAYHGWSDLASHARRGQTPRNTPMFSHPGTIYVYFTYGMHWMLNLVCGKEGFPSAVLIRGLAISSHVRKNDKSRNLDGPAKLTKRLKIDKKLNALPLGKRAGLWVEDRGVKIPAKQVHRTGRIGVDYSGEWAKKPWRFVIQNEPKNTKSRNA